MVDITLHLSRKQMISLASKTSVELVRDPRASSTLILFIYNVKNLFILFVYFLLHLSISILLANLLCSIFMLNRCGSTFVLYLKCSMKASYSLSISSEIAASNLTLSSCPVEYFILIKCMSLFVHTERNNKFIFKNLIFLKTKSLSISQFG